VGLLDHCYSNNRLKIRIIISSPGFKPNAKLTRCIAEVPLFTEITFFDFVNFLINNSKFLTYSPPDIQLELSALFKNFFSKLPK